MQGAPFSLSYSDFKSSGLWRNAECHKVSMAYPDTHARGKAVKVHRPSKPVKNKSVVWNIKADNGKWIAVTDGCETAVLSVYFQNGAHGDIILRWAGIAIWVWKKIVHIIPQWFDIN